MGLGDGYGHEYAAEFGELLQERRLRRQNGQGWKTWSLEGSCKRLQHHLLLISAILKCLDSLAYLASLEGCSARLPGVDRSPQLQDGPM